MWIILDEPQIKSSLIQQVPVMFRKLLQPVGVYRTHNDCPINLPARRRRSRSWLPACWQTSVEERWATVAHLTSLTSGRCTSHRRLWTSVNAASSFGSATPWTASTEFKLFGQLQPIPTSLVRGVWLSWAWSKFESNRIWSLSWVTVEVSSRLMLSVKF